MILYGIKIGIKKTKLRRFSVSINYKIVKISNFVTKKNATNFFSRTTMNSAQLKSLNYVTPFTEKRCLITNEVSINWNAFRVCKFC